MTIRCVELNKFYSARLKILDRFHTIPSKKHDWTIRTEANEAICLDPSRKSYLSDVLSKRWGPAALAICFKLVEESD